MKKTFSLVVVRHGQAYQNVTHFESQETDFRFDEGMKILDSDLTQKGQMQANLVGKRLKDRKFDIAMSSDLKRAAQTAVAIIILNDSINKLEICKALRERYMGDLAGNMDLCYPIWKNDYANFEHRDNQKSKPLNGESVADVRLRVREFIKEMLQKVAEGQVDSPNILVVSHGQFMFELYSIISDIGYSPSNGRHNPWHQNTGITEYSITCTAGRDNQLIIDKVECPTHSCANHLHKFDEEYKSCWGGCHAFESPSGVISSHNTTRPKKVKTFTLTIVRHGQAYQNTPGYILKEADVTQDGTKRIWNSDLTETGLKQANLIAQRFENVRFDLVIASDMKRTKQTAEAVMRKNSSIQRLVSWPVVRERYMGDFEFDREFCKSLRPIDDAVCDRDMETEGPANGESLANLRDRVRKFLLKVQKEVLKIQTDLPSVLVVSHNQFMFELYSVISSSEYGKLLSAPNVRYQNTGIALYHLTSNHSAPDNPILEDARCSILSCANHLKSNEESYVGCIGGCHDQTNVDVKRK